MSQRDAGRSLYQVISEEVRNEISTQLTGSASTMLNVSQFQPAAPIWNQVMTAVNQLVVRLQPYWRPWGGESFETNQIISLVQARAAEIAHDGEVNREVACRNFVRAVSTFVQPTAHRSYVADYGLYRVGSLAIFDYINEVLDLRQETAAVEGITSIAQNSGWCLPYENYCFVCERPTSILVDSDGRLHNSDGPAITYADGWSIYVWHGVCVPRRVIMDSDAITADEIQGEDNVEIRRVMIERVGMMRFLTESGAREIHKDECGVLYRQEVPRDEPVLIVKVTNRTAEPDGTFKEYFLRVPPNIKTAKDAVAWTFGITGSEYDPVAET